MKKIKNSSKILMITYGVFLILIVVLIILFKVKFLS